MYVSVVSPQRLSSLLKGLEGGGVVELSSCGCCCTSR